jgi:hypothetical protein
MSAMALIPERAAQHLRRELSAGGPPVDVEQIAWRMGVDEIVLSAIVGDGRLECREGKTSIYVQVRAGQARRRFTIAHEIAHLWLQENRRDYPGAPGGGHEEERFCNAFAAALLMPPSWVRERACAGPSTLDNLDQIASNAKVSLAACLLQLRRFAGWQTSLLNWTWDRGNWRLWSTAGLPISCQRQVTSLRQTRVAITRAEQEGGRIQKVPLILRVGGESLCVPAEVKVRRGRAVALAALEPGKDFGAAGDSPLRTVPQG